jgi:cellulose biosynthesis protein BcsQ
MNRQPFFIAFSTQKGGAGKTTLTVLTASYLHYAKGYNVAIVDCDYPQFSIADMRKRDVEQVMSDPHYKRMARCLFDQIGKKAYPVVECSAVDAVAKAEELQKAEEEGLTQEEFNDRMNNPDLYQIEDPSENRSHVHEMPDNKPGETEENGQEM